MTQKPEREFDLQNMRLALEQACMSRPSPNPPVGAVVVSAEGQLVAAAHHVRAGTDHAEVLALRAAGPAARGGVLYVTLEPCNHAGVTPPCVDAILEAGVKRVVIGCIDPNPHVTGGGAKRLEAAGVAVDLGVAGLEARGVIAAWSKFVTTGFPQVSLKLASSLDGRIASRSGASKWVTGPEARAKVQELRAAHDAVAVGIGTVIADDPQLTVRDESLLPGGRNPTRVLFDTKLRMPLGSKMLETIKVAPVWLIAGNDAPADAEAALTDAGCVVLRVPTSGEGRVEISAALRAVAQRGIVSVLFEGGAELAGSLLASRLADELHVFIAPLLLGPRGRAAAVDWAGPDTPADAPRLEDPSWEVCGRDAYVTGAISYPERGG
jgi:diaminohydroxyphosphoribosylaminopyrimidine deaminase/5-amino-6-(5-phosphoribosylamino)uracil reductase